MNQCESLECDCGEIESVQHFLLECPLYEEEHDELLKNLFSQLGINYLYMDLLLGYSENENIPGWRESIINELGLVAFTAELLMRTYHNNPLTVSNTKSLKYICGNFTFEALNLHHEKSTLEKIVPLGLIRNTDFFISFKYVFHVDAERMIVRTRKMSRNLHRFKKKSSLSSSIGIQFIPQ